jgi:hypothetical protein
MQLDAERYARIKSVSNTELGIVTQCVVLESRRPPPGKVAKTSDKSVLGNIVAGKHVTRNTRRTTTQHNTTTQHDTQHLIRRTTRNTTHSAMTTRNTTQHCPVSVSTIV